jgi:mevalonate kinase
MLQIERINRWAFVGECCIHGNPSGVDNTVSSGGKAVLFQRKDYSKPPVVKPLRDFPELPLLLVNTKQSRSTATEVAKVAALKKRHPQITEDILDAIDKCTRSAYELIMNDDFDAEDPAALSHLGDLITVNHGLLVSLGVSHPKLERIRALIDHAGIGWTKLTGAGGGGCAITIIKPPSLLPTETADALPSLGSGRRRSKSTVLHDLERQLEREGFERFATTLGGDGVGVLWPAVLHNGSGEEGGEDIDQDKFLNAVGNEGIESLVGVCGLDGGRADVVREGWKFWRC